jgi:ABC-type uncharacterized transport system permease subunit
MINVRKVIPSKGNQLACGLTLILLALSIAAFVALNFTGTKDE